MNTNEKAAISCDDALLLLENDPASPDLSAHLARCADCRAEARVRELMRQLNAEVPAGLCTSVMDQIRAQRVREASRLRWMRRVGALAAAAVLVPAAVILAPIMLRADRAVMTDGQVEQTVSAAATETTVPETVQFTAAGSSDAPAETVPETVQETKTVTVTATSAHTYADTASPTAAEETKGKLIFAVPPNVQGGIVTSEAAPPSTAPEYVAKKTQDAGEKSGGLSTMAADSTDEPMTTAPAPLPEPLKLDPAYSVIMSIAGAEEVQMYTVISASSVVTPAELCRHFGITREAFESGAAALSLTFTEEELRRIFE